MKKIKEKAEKLAERKIAYIGSVSSENAPNIKAMLVAKHDGIKTFYFASNNSAMRTEQFKQNKKACVYMNGGLFYKGLMLEGTMEIVNDRETKVLVWNKNLQGIYKNGGVDDPDYCVLKFTAKTARLYCKYESKSFEIEDGKKE
ncbi:MAG: pyridoxamine 5'-phosphate oxidase family protein [Treponema sp.]|nr:pyridoxamine 5'-phosphate oxidase family protein [Treponema sp.]